ncbi:MAG: tail fiber protein [Myxococcota bacterium]
MAEPFLGQIIMCGFNFAPRGYATCDGQLLSIAQNSALFSLIGTYFGGDGIETFALPDLRGRGPVHAGQGPGLSAYVQGEVSGTERVTLLGNHLPTHNHTVAASAAAATDIRPGPSAVLAGQAGYSAEGVVNTTLATNALTSQGTNQPHNNMQPYTVINFAIALEGIYPSRN